MNLNELRSALLALSADAEVQRVAELLEQWKSDRSTVTELDTVVERCIGNVRFTSESLHAMVHDLWCNFRREAICGIGGMTMNERLYWFSLTERFDSSSTHKAAIYHKLLARP